MRKTDSSLFLELDCRLQWSDFKLLSNLKNVFMPNTDFGSKIKAAILKKDAILKKIGYFTGVHS